ncbi:MAG: hypothetical protein M1816_008271 [Peltula sp. TS41687]|nr:MAG: hypothetical protein M1816_008271 [Peltula sp. TS41687]
MASNNDQQSHQLSDPSSRTSSSMGIGPTGGRDRISQIQSIHSSRSVSPRAAAFANTVPRGPRAWSKAKGATRRLPPGPSTVTNRGPPSAHSRPNNAFVRPVPTGHAFRGPAPLVVNDEWKTWDEVSIKIRGLPHDITTLALYKVFQDEGSLDYIDLYEDSAGRKDGNARIRFRPPPKRAFWIGGRYELRKAEGGVIIVDVSLEGKRNDFSVPSPINPKIKYPATTVSDYQSVYDCEVLLLTWWKLLNPTSISFGYMHDSTTMVAMHSSNSQRTGSITFQLDLTRKFIDVRFILPIRDPQGTSAMHIKKFVPLSQRNNAIGSLNRDEKYRFRIPIEQLQVIKEVEEKTRERSLIISLATPPCFYRKAGGPQLAASHDENVSYWSEFHTWFRQTDIVYNPRELRTASVALKKAKPVIDIGRWTTYRFVFDKAECNSTAYKTLCNALRDYNVSFEKSDEFRMTSEHGPAIWEWIDPPAYKSSTPRSFLAEMESTVVALSYPVRYQLEVCISQGRLNEHNLDKDFVEKLAQMNETKALDILIHVAQQKERIYDPKTLLDLELITTPIAGLKIPHYCALTRKATITPTTIYLSTPVVETSNRVVRQYLEHSDRFLRVQFTDEKHEGRINSTEKDMNNEIFTRIRRTLINGITIGDRHFEFLAFGNSQFREHGAFFFSPTPYLKTEDILRWMGSFDHIRSVALYASRLGQCFSTTRAIHGIRVQVRQIADVEKNNYNFTDGVGKISEALAKLVAGELHLTFVPSVFQFRLGGCKGILAMWPDARNWEIHIRKSQYKFEATHNGLEIIRCSQFAAAALNRQVILVLSALGVPDGVFVNKLKDMLSNLERAMVDQPLLLEMLQKQVDANQMTLTLAGMVSEGFMRTKEPFMISLIQLWRAWTIKYVKERARIVIDDGAFLLGCTDESRTLRGQLNQSRKDPPEFPPKLQTSLPEIFLQIPDTNHPGRYKIIEGLCLLGRNPSLHPGDIRVVMAVNQPELHHIRDAVVLPQTGDRDVASMCSGGDLDGDDFFVIWDVDLLPRDWTQLPMDYMAPKPAQLTRGVQKDDITSFFVQYMRNDCLPRIAHAHLAWADYMVSGVKDDRCLRLAGLHSKAVDYVKTGDPAIMPRELAPRRWPHFMEKKKPKEKIYHSRKILGQLYDLVERVDFVPLYHSEFDGRILNAYELEAEMLQHAREIKEKYDADMRRIMAQHGISTEFEVWSTFVLNHDQTSKDYKFQEEIGQIAFALKGRYRDACIEKAGGKGFDVLGPFVAAMYKVTQEEVVAALGETREFIMVDGQTVPKRKLDARTMPLMSFPWCFTDVMGRVAQVGASVPQGIHPVEVIEVKKAPVTKTSRVEVEGEGDAHHEVTSYQVEKRKDTPPPLVNLQDDEDDVIETVGGVTHLGEMLELFKNGAGADTNSPGASEGKDDDAKSQSPASESPVWDSSNGSGTLGRTIPLGSAPNSDTDGDVEPSPETLSPLGGSSGGIGALTQEDKWVKEDKGESLEDVDGSDVDEEEVVTFEESTEPTALEALEKLVLDESQHANA